MLIAEVIEKIVKLPSEDNGSENISIYDLLKRTGYFDVYEQIHEYDIRTALLQNPKLINAWLSFSEDKRCLGWYFKKLDEKFIVGFIDRIKGDTKISEYSDSFEACSVFIKHEIEDVRAI